MDFVELKDNMPIKGRDIIAIDKEGSHHYIFRCACSNENCNDYRCSLTGYNISIEFVKWKYDE